MKVSYQTASGPMEVELAETALTVLYPGGRVDVPYANLTALTLGDQLYLSAGPGSTMGIPLYAFSSQEHLNAFGRALMAKNPHLAVTAAPAAPQAPAPPEPDDGDDDDDELSDEETKAIMAEMQKYFRPDGRPGRLLMLKALWSFIGSVTIGRFRSLQKPSKAEIEETFAEAVRVDDARSLYEATQNAADGHLWAYTEVDGLTGDRRCLVSLTVEPPGQGPSREQWTAYEYMKLNFPRFKPAIVQALMDYNREMRRQAQADYKSRGGAVLRGVGSLILPPDIKSPKKFETLLQTPRWELRREHKDGLAYVAVCYGPRWTVNTEGVLMHGDRIVYVGSDPDFTDFSD